MAMKKRRLEDAVIRTEPYGIDVVRQEMERQLTDQNVVVLLSAEQARTALRDTRITKSEYDQIKNGTEGDDLVRFIVK